MSWGILVKDYSGTQFLAGRFFVERELTPADCLSGYTRAVYATRAMARDEAKKIRRAGIHATPVKVTVDVRVE